MYLHPEVSAQKYCFKVSKNNIVIRETKREDNAKIEAIAKAGFQDFGIPPNRVYEDVEEFVD